MSRNEMRQVINELQKAVDAGGRSGHFLANAYLSFYRRGNSVELYDYINLDAINRDLFHRMMRLRHIADWSDSELHVMYQFCSNYLNDMATLSD